MNICCLCFRCSPCRRLRRHRRTFWRLTMRRTPPILTNNHRWQHWNMKNSDYLPTYFSRISLISFQQSWEPSMRKMLQYMSICDAYSRKISVLRVIQIHRCITSVNSRLSSHLTQDLKLAEQKIELLYFFIVWSFSSFVQCCQFIFV